MRIKKKKGTKSCDIHICGGLLWTLVSKNIEIWRDILLWKFFEALKFSHENSPQVDLCSESLKSFN